MLKKTKKKLKDLWGNIREGIKNTLYFILFFKCALRPKAAFLESRNGDDFAGNLYYLAQELQRRNIRVYVGYKRQHREKIEKILQTGDFSHVRLVRMYSCGYYYALATAKYLATDICFDWKYIKRDGQVVINTWHGTPLKTIGFDVPNEKYIMGNIQRCLMMTDYIISPSPFYTEKMLSCMNIDKIFPGKILQSGYPRNAVFFDSQKAQKTRQERGAEDKQVIVYMPTWRGTHAGASQSNDLQEHLAQIEQALGDHQEFYVKLHNMDRNRINLSGFEKVKPFPENIECYEFLAAADCLVTDYSSVFFDFANSGKKVVLFTYDEEEYYRNRKVYFPITELPFAKVRTVAELIREIGKEKNYDDTAFRARFCTYDRPDAASQIVRHWTEGSSDLEEQRITPNGKKNVLIYCGGLNFKNGIITSLKNILAMVDTDSANLFFSFVRPSLSHQPQIISDLGPGFQLYPISSPLQRTLTEMVAYNRYFRKYKKNRIYLHYWERLMRREVKKHFPVPCFDVVIDFEGYGSHHMIPLLQRYPGKRVIFVHNDMVQEINVRKNQHPDVLRDAYASADIVAVVTKDMIDATAAVSGRTDNIRVVNNSHNYLGFRQKSMMPITFDKDTEVVTACAGGLEGILSSKGYTFITIGRFSPEKAHMRLLDAFDCFCDTYSDAQLIIIGGHGVLYNATIKKIKQLRHWRNVTVIKSISNPMPILKRCDLFILSSLYEGLGLVLLEADCLGVPSFSTDIVGPKNFMKQYGGHLVPNSTYGILQGMYDFVNGKVHTFDIDYAEYNKQAVKMFESLYTPLEDEK